MKDFDTERFGKGDPTDEATVLFKCLRLLYNDSNNTNDDLMMRRHQIIEWLLESIP